MNILDGGKFFLQVLEEFSQVKTKEQYRDFFQRYDVWIILIPLIKLKDKTNWEKFWDLTYDISLELEKDLFLYNISKNGLFSKKDFIDYQISLFDGITKGNILPFDTENDMTVVFNDQNIDILFCFCDSLIHSVKETRLFTKETCRESIYFYRATKKNKYFEKIVFNQMMQKVCMSFLDYYEK